MGFAKTEAGRQEIEARTRRLPTALRSILLMVDGQRSDAELRSLIEGLKAPPDALEQLLDMGLIADTWNLATGKPVARATASAPASADLAAALPAAAVASPSADAPVAVSDAVAVAAPAVQAVARTSTVPAATPDAAGEYRWLYDRMSGAVGRYLGLKGYFLQLKVERCTDVASLQLVLPDLEIALRKARGDAFTEQWLEETRQPVSS
ncbi:hypothetical protein ARC20_17385 [Stenotrophomonas panacihumi]|uniref:Proline-rich protein n=1 Tax=Stenotrophomonas panacihumi TaxID=676599 RepID=A0A0R0B337_9GAMM|nr:hypothetical protein [Stenotrophomonas panacihumi]KRG48183.1 hypothetical protein ARC20_17385 [Stenotrophomonas panacihumi]PTN54053.1 hypothetical protein C9J98_12535 [Stenotrophomonas panacihumi]